ncbi:hypothetical protein APHAL10511_001506 [Amanita phalloides]|nr:hypothetical protein APHAL10511_001506 [Amanita phalloides]
MPAPVYVVAAGITAAAATYAFFIYEPHIAPALERLAEDFIERRRAYRRERELQRQRERGGWHLADPVQEIPLSARASSGDRADGDGLIRHAGVKREETLESNSTDKGNNAGKRPAPSPPAPGFSDLGSGVAIGLTPQEVNEWRNTVNNRTSLRQRKSRVVSAKSGDDASPSGTSTVWDVDVAAHVLDEPNQLILQTPISPTLASKSPFLSGSSTPSYADRTEQRGQQRTPSTQVSPILNPHRPHRLSDGPNSNRTSLSFVDSGVSASSPSTLGLGLGSVFIVGEHDGSAPSTTTQRTVALSDEGETPVATTTTQDLILRLNMDDPSLGVLLTPPKTTSSSPDRMTVRAESPVDPFLPSEPSSSHFNRNPNPNPSSNPISNPIPNPNPNLHHHHHQTDPVLSLSQSYPISLDYEQGIELVSHPSESEPASSEYAFGSSSLGTPSDRPSSPEVILVEGAASPFVQLSPPPPPRPLPPLPNPAFDPGSVPTIRQVMDEARSARSTLGSPLSASSPTMFYSFTDDRQTAGQNVTQEQRTPDILSPMISELEFSSDDGHTSSFTLNDDFGSESSWTSARV